MSGFHMKSRRETRRITAFIDPIPLPVRPSGSPTILPLEANRVTFTIVDEGRGFMFPKGYMVEVNDRVRAYPDRNNGPLLTLTLDLLREYARSNGLRTAPDPRTPGSC
ncbi:hypothetical protein [Bifidobacterium sp. SO1]|uniref:hypothetical protein n=1 Tax=Bifidobacterium sp. SO1 TaxID=2809029 RepID=UPI001BDC319D|nr:hypothetical protein [Bifidobacterium sp. SO1]MBT1161707.1 hypothetical protein [Bifidobacterium sp. SO1]